MIAKVHTTNDMAKDIEDIFVWGEDFEAVLAILEEDGTVDLHFTSSSFTSTFFSSRLVNEHLTTSLFACTRHRVSCEFHLNCWFLSLQTDSKGRNHLQRLW